MSRSFAALWLGLALAVPHGAVMGQDLQIPFEKFVLDNGLEVVVHEDHSDPIVSVFVVYHVGSGREEPGRSGFAHLFEHLMFQGSQNVGDDEHFRLVSEAGGTLNGTTNRDRTNYFETLPSNQLELALWLEADRMGFLLPAITQEKLDNQREVVKNERRQNYENRPYAQAYGLMLSTLYPSDHSYNWTTIGSHEDLSAASLEDVVQFFQRWYGPNNATLAVGGDVDPQRVRELAEKYFGSIPRGPEVTKPERRPAKLEQDVRLAMEDRVQLPQLSFTWPAVADNSEDEAALEMLGSVLSANKAALLDKALMVDETLVTYVTAGLSAGEMAGEFGITVRAAPGVSLDLLEQRVRSIIADLGRDGVEPERLARLKSRYEARLIRRLETLASRTSSLAEGNVFRNDPASIVNDLQRVLAVTPAEVEQALHKYILGRPAVLVSVVPEGRLDMVASGRDETQLAKEADFDRSRPPSPGPTPEFRAPVVWHDTLANGVPVVGTPYDEVPLVQVTLSVPGGHLRESLDTLGLSSLTAELMEEGTEELDTVGMTNALDSLGAALSVSSSSDEITFSLRTLHKNLDAAVTLLGDVLLRPRFAPSDFERLRTQRLAELETRGDSIRTVARNVWARLQYADESPAAWPSSGTLESIAALTLDDVKDFYRKAVVPDGARLVVVGDLDGARVRELFASVVDRWTPGDAAPLADTTREATGEKCVYLVDKPSSPQSEIRIGHPGMSALDDDFYPFSIMNYVLGGSFSSRINMNLREDKGYTYGARSALSAGLRPGTFTAYSAVRTDATGDSVSEFMKELRSITEGLTDEEAAFAKDAMLEAMNRQFESITSLETMLDRVSKFGYPDDYLVRRHGLLQRIQKDDLDALAKAHVRLDDMAVLVVGDAEQISAELEELDMGPIVPLDIDGNPVESRL